MSSEASATDVMQQALQLSEQQRADLAAKLLDSLESEADDDVVQAWQQEVQRRLAELKSEEAETVP